ncbi:MAG TPA: dihydrolipoamide acetyltransferase family protein [Geobacteraceae bacterium]
MPTNITMPKLSDTMTEGRLISWKKSVGERVERGDIIAEVETDKATMELEAFTSGILLETRVKPGEVVSVGTIIALVGAPEEAAVPQSPPKAKAPPAAEQAPAAGEKAEPASLDAGEVPERIMEPVQEEASVARKVSEGEKAAPVVRRLARERGVDLAVVPGSGPGGRVLLEDLEGYLEHQTRGAEAEESRGVKGAAAITGVSQPLTRMRGAIARTVTEAWHTIPHFAVTVAVDMAEVERVRQELRVTGSDVSVNDIVVKASAVALEKFPRVNATFADDRIVTHSDINIGVAVALDDGLLVPVIKGCQGLTLKEIAAMGKTLVDRARSGKISEAEIAGGTFSISNLGMFGVEHFMAVIHPPQGAILAVGAILDQPVIRGGYPVAGRIMRATLSADHRLIDGALAARFLAELKKMLENPVTLLV